MSNTRGRPRHPDILTPAEWRVLEQIRQGLTNPEIADELGLSVNTVRYHVSNILAKLELRDREAARRWRGEKRSHRAWGALATVGIAKVATSSALVLASVVLIGASISLTRGGERSVAPAATPTSANAARASDEPDAVPSVGPADAPDAAGQGLPSRSTLLPIPSAAATTLMCREESPSILETFGPHEVYEAIAALPPELIATGSAHWVNAEGCVIHAPPIDLEQLFAAMGEGAPEIPEELKLQCLLAEPLIPAGTRVQPIQPTPDTAGGRAEHRLITSGGDPLPRPLTVIAYCDMTGDGLRVGLGGN